MAAVASSTVEQADVANQGQEEALTQELSAKHPLQYSWVLWFDKPDKKGGSSWADCLKKVYTISYVEDFWSVYNSIKAASDLPHGSNYSLFKEGVEPKWEDAANENGGKWVVTLDSGNREAINDVWLNLMLALVGEAFGASGDLITGAVCSSRKGNNRLGLWTRNFKDRQQQMEIGRLLKQILEVPSNLQIGYQAHVDCQKMNRSTNVMNKYEV